MQRDTSHESAPGPSKPALNSDSSSTSTDNVCRDLTLPRRNGVNATCEACRQSNTEVSLPSSTYLFLKVAARLIDLYSVVEASPHVSHVLRRILLVNMHLLRRKQRCGCENS
jgi:biotin synthase-related radical SAM superfamily protein